MRMITIKRAITMAVLLLAIAALAFPMMGLRVRAAAGPVRPAMTTATPVAKAAVSNAAKNLAKDSGSLQKRLSREGDLFNREPFVVDTGGPTGSLGPEAMSMLGFSKDPKSRKKAARLAKKNGGGILPQAGFPLTLNARSALSAALMTNIGGRDTQFSEVTLLADWDGREDCAADRAVKVDDFSPTEPDIDFVLTRTAISEHTIANGFNENIFYYGDSVGNVWIGADTDGNGTADNINQINIPTTLGSLSFPLDDQVAITGLAVNPVLDAFGGDAGEVLWGTFTDSEGFTSGGGGGTLQRGGLFFILIQDIPDVGFPVTITGPGLFAISSQSSLGGVAVDDDGSVYWHLADLIQQTGGRIVKAVDIDGDRFPDVAFFAYSGASTTFGNIVSIAAGPCNTIYAAVARSAVPGDPSAGATGMFTNPTALGPTPSMIISFADCAGAFDFCTAPATGVSGTLPAANSIADVAVAGQTLVPGVNNFRVFALGNGPDIRPPAGGTAVVPGTPASVLKLDMQIDFQAHAGITINEEGTVFVISGGAPGGPGTNPSPMVSEILCFEDACPADRRADFVDLRGNAFPNPPASGGNLADGDSDRFDHIFAVAPIDQVTLTPTGLSGLSQGFLRYMARLAPNPIGPGVTLGVTDPTQSDDSTSGPIVFELLDPGHQVAGGDDQNPPFRGDDNNGFSNPDTANNPPLIGPLSGGFEFLFGAAGSPGSTCTNNVWNAFFLNSNGNITFDGGDTANTPTVPDFRSGLARIAPAWTDLNPDARAVDPRAFPLLAMGFANVNAFKIRWINVPQFGFEGCVGSDTLGFQVTSASNTFSVTLYDDGTGRDENEAQAFNPANPIGNNSVPFDEQEGPTDLRFALEPTTGFLVGCPPRPEGSGHFIFDYCRMDLLGTDVQPVIVGYSAGGLSILNPPGLCETNLSEAARAADAGPFGVVQGQTASIMPCLIGEGTEPTIFELFNSGSGPRLGSGGEIAFATPDFDLRFEGNDPALCTPIRQRDLNRGRVGFFGLTCPVNPLCLAVTPVGTVAVAPGQPAVGTAAAGTPGTGPGGTRAASPTAGIINAICSVQLNVLGCGFFPNETTIVCQGFSNETGVPLQRPGKTVTSALALSCDTNGDGIADVVIPLTAVTPVNKNLVQGTLGALGTVGLPGTAFPLTCCGGVASLTLTTTFTAGDNNIFGPFTRTTACGLDLGLRAPVIISVTPSEGDCAVAQDLLISGACFIINGLPNVTSVFAVELGNPNNVIPATRFVILNANLIDALFSFGSVNAGKTFLIFASGPNGTSQNLTALPAGSAGCPLGNQQGVQAFFRCRTGTPGGGGGAADLAVVEGCSINRSASGKRSLEVTGRNFKEGATMTIGGQSPKKLKFKGEVQTGSNISFTRIIGSGKVKCSMVPGQILVTNPGAAASAPFQCNTACN